MTEMPIIEGDLIGLGFEYRENAGAPYYTLQIVSTGYSRLRLHKTSRDKWCFSVGRGTIVRDLTGLADLYRLISALRGVPIEFLEIGNIS